MCAMILSRYYNSLSKRHPNESRLEIIAFNGYFLSMKKNYLERQNWKLAFSGTKCRNAKHTHWEQQHPVNVLQNKQMKKVFVIYDQMSVLNVPPSQLNEV